jgi:hypothetical protein
MDPCHISNLTLTLTLTLILAFEAVNPESQRLVSRARKVKAATVLMVKSQQLQVTLIPNP